MKHFTMTAAEAAAHNARVSGRAVPSAILSPDEASVSLMLRPMTDEAKLNKTERAFLAVLRAEQRLGIHSWIGVQNITLKLGDDCRYTPDFFCIGFGGCAVAYEVKGFMRDDALVKLKVAARLFSWIAFILVKNSKDGWKRTDVKP